MTRRFGAFSRQERHQADLFFVDLMGASTLRRRGPDEEQFEPEPTVGPSDQAHPRVSNDELVRRAGRVHHTQVQVYPLVEAFLVGRVRMRNRIVLKHNHLLKQAFRAYRDPKERWVLGVGSSFVYRLADRKITSLVREATAAVEQIEWGVYLASPLGPRQSMFRVILVARDDIPRLVWAGARRAIEAELDAVAAESSRPAVARGFEVEVRNTLTAREVRALDRRDFSVYVFDRVPFVERVRTTVRRHLQQGSDDLVQGLVDRVMAQMEREGGANVGIDEQEVSFISTAVYKAQYKSQGGDQDARRGASQRIAELALHEIGHGLRAPHDPTGIMNETAAASIADPARQFSQASRRRIRSRLEQLARP